MKNFWSFFRAHNLKIGIIYSAAMTILSIVLWIYPVNQNPHLAVNYKDYDLVTVAEPNDNLTILVNGNDIKKQDLNLKVYSISLRNIGESDISSAMYDAESPLTIRLTNCDLLNCNVVTAPSNPQGAIHLNSDSTAIILNNVLLKKGDKIELKLTVLHKTQSKPSLNVSGRIANTEISINESEPNSIWDYARFVFWLAVIIGGIWFLGFVFGFFDALVTGLVRMYRSNLFTRLYYIKYKELEHQKILIQLYGRFGKKKFVEVMEHLVSTDNGTQIYKNELQNILAVARTNQLRKEDKIDTSIVKKDIEYTAPIVLTVTVLKKYDLLSTDTNDNITVSNLVTEEIKTMLEVLRL